VAECSASGGSSRHPDRQDLAHNCRRTATRRRRPH